MGTGYTRYFNDKYKRTGALFQGKFKSIHVDSNEYLLHVSAYVNLNDRVHKLNQFGGKASKFLLGSESSWREYTGEGKKGFCEKGIILEQFKNRVDYKKFAEDSLRDIVERRDTSADLKDFLLE